MLEQLARIKFFYLKIFLIPIIFLPTALCKNILPCSLKNEPLILSALNRPKEPYNYDLMELNQWFNSSRPYKGVALLLHGLNNKPSSMNPLALHFSSLGHLVLRGSLRGHRGSLKENKKVTIDQWREDIDGLYCLASLKSQQFKAPLIINCYSMGCLLFLDLFKRRRNKNKKNIVQKAIVISPAFKIKPVLTWSSQVLKLLPSKWMIPSSNIRSYRSQYGTSISSYKAFFQLIDQNPLTDLIKPNAPIFPPTLMLINPKDELVDTQRIKQVFQKKNRGSTPWKIIEVENKNATTIKHINHLLLDESSLGKLKWIEWIEHISLFLKPEKPTTLY